MFLKLYSLMSLRPPRAGMGFLLFSYICINRCLFLVRGGGYLNHNETFSHWHMSVDLSFPECGNIIVDFKRISSGYTPRVLEFYFNALQRGNGPTQFKEETTVIDFQEESTKYTAALTAVWDGENSGLHLSVHTESTPKVFQVRLQT
jgi:hypothetical protein